MNCLCLALLLTLATASAASNVELEVPALPVVAESDDSKLDKNELPMETVPESRQDLNVGTIGGTDRLMARLFGSRNAEVRPLFEKYLEKRHVILTFLKKLFDDFARQKCNSAFLQSPDRISHRVAASSFITYDEDITIRGVEHTRITAIRVNRANSNLQNGRPSIRAGGLGYNYVTLRFLGTTNQGFEYNIDIHSSVGC